MAFDHLWNPQIFSSVKFMGIISVKTRREVLFPWSSYAVVNAELIFPHFVSYSWVMEAFLPISNGDGRIWIFFWTSLLLEVTRSYLFSQVPLLLNVVLATNFKEIRGFCKGIIDFMVSIFLWFYWKNSKFMLYTISKKKMDHTESLERAIVLYSNWR